MEQQYKQPSKLKRFWKETVRVMRILKKPDRTEYFGLTKVTGLGLAIIGVIGFILFLLKQFLV